MDLKRRLLLLVVLESLLVAAVIQIFNHQFQLAQRTSDYEEYDYVHLNLNRNRKKSKKFKPLIPKKRKYYSDWVDGWTVNTSKRVSDYVNDSLSPHLMPTNFCAKGGLLLVMVTTRPQFSRTRQILRQTWARKRENVSFYFIVGETNFKQYQTALESESKRDNDIIQERFRDTYNNLTLKSINLLKLFTLHCARNYQYLMKIDDDVFLNIENFLEMLEKRNTSTNLLMGKVYKSGRPIRSKRISTKWFVPYTLYAERRYPDYVCGATYVMSSDVAVKIYKVVPETPIFFIEDIYVTGICAKKVNVTRQHSALFTCDRKMKRDVCLHKHLYTMHYFKRDEIVSAHEKLEQKMCSKNITTTTVKLK